MHQKISYEIFSKRGKLHEKQGKENEDAINVVTNGDYIFAILSDGAGSSKFAKETAWCTVNTTADFCCCYGDEFFTDNREQIARNFILDVQQALYEQATNFNTDLSQMMCTLILLCIDTKSMQYTIIHIGDGLIAKITDNETEIISYPENGVTKQYTYMANSPSVMKHLRIKYGEFYESEQFFICTDGAVENCYSTQEYIKRIKNKTTQSNDDITYCIINL